MIKNIIKEKKINYSFILFLLSMVVLNTYILISINEDALNKAVETITGKKMTENNATNNEAVSNETKTEE